MDRPAHRGHDDLEMPRFAEDLTSVEGHVVQFYEGDEELTSAVVRFASAGLAAGEGVLVVATPEHRVAVEAALLQGGHDLEGYVAFDAAETLARIVGDDGRVERSRFLDVIGPALAATADGPGRHVRVFGEMVARLSAAGDPEGALALEALWNELATGPQRFTLLCAYPSPAMDDAAGAGFFYEACAQHTAVVEAWDAPLTAWQRFDAHPTEIAAARRFVKATLRRWGLETVADDASVVVSELATNALLHARSPFHVSLTVLADTGVRVAVHDESSARPSPRGHSVTSATGRGLRLIDALASSWGTTPLPDRKAVWAELVQAGR